MRWLHVKGSAGRDILESPETVLMKICIVSSGSEALELMLEMLDERRIVAISGVVTDEMRRYEDVGEVG
jgi:hypothetical protein